MPATPHKLSQKCLRWKQKNRQKQQRIKQLQTKIAQLTRSRQRWHHKYRQLKADQQPQRVKHHPYSLSLMLLGVVFHIQHNISLRACRLALLSIAQHYGQPIKPISASTIRNWCRRLGHYYLQGRLQAGSYVLMADESVLIGSQKLLLLVAVRQQQQQCRIAPLQMADVQVIHVEPAASWPGARIAQLIELHQQPGVTFSYAVSDKASNLRKAFRIANIAWVEDLTHRLANLTQRLLTSQPAFSAFMASQQLTRAKWILSPYAIYLPPCVRKKARQHQLLRSAEWAARILAQWAQLPAAVQQELAYVVAHRALIRLLQQVQQLVNSFSVLIKGRGLSRWSQQRWQQQRLRLQAAWQQQGWAVSAELGTFMEGLEQYLSEQVDRALDADAVLCCSDVVESLFGKYKYQSARQVISDDCVSIAAYGRSICGADVSAALQAIPQSFLHEQEVRQEASWLKLRREALPKVAS